jgi:hypothetical protein
MTQVTGGILFVAILPRRVFLVSASHLCALGSQSYYFLCDLGETKIVILQIALGTCRT